MHENTEASARDEAVDEDVEMPIIAASSAVAVQKTRGHKGRKQSQTQQDESISIQIMAVANLEGRQVSGQLIQSIQLIFNQVIILVMPLYPLLFTLLIPSIFATKCENNATYIEKQDFCSCPPNCIGRTCNLTAYELKETDTKIPVSSNYTFAYFKPQQKVIYRFLLTFCPVNKTQEMSLLVFAQQEQKNGEVYTFPKKQQFVGIEIGGSKNCRQILSSVLVSFEKKSNEELVRIIFGFKLTSNNADKKDQFILVKCQTNSIFTVNFLVTILIAFLVIVTLFLIISVVLLVRKKLIDRREQMQREMKKMNCVNQLMPTKKYEILIQQQSQSNSNEYDVVCSICLCQFEKGQDVRKTPCKHIYHSRCLESWCNAHLNCPICRSDFEKQTVGRENVEMEMRGEMGQEVLGPETTNIRQPIL